MSLQPRNTKIMRREGPWGQAGPFRSRYLTLTDATAGRLERSRSHPWPLCCSLPPNSPRPGSIEALTGQPRAEGREPWVTGGDPSPQVWLSVSSKKRVTAAA